MSFLQKYFRGTIATSVLREVGNVETINSQSIRVLERDYDDNVSECTGIVEITAGGSGYAVGCEYVDTDAAAGAQIYTNEGTATSCLFTLVQTSSNSAITTEISLTPAELVAMYTTPKTLIAGVAGKVIEFLGAAVFYDYGVATYTGGGNVSVIEEDGNDVSTVASAANSIASATDELNILKPVEATYQPTAGKGLELTNATGVFVNPGTATGSVRVNVTYRVHTTGL